VFYGQRGQIGIVQEVRLNTGQSEKPPEDCLVLSVGCGTQTGAQPNQATTWFQARAVGDDLPRTRGFVTMRRNARILVHGNPTRVEPFN